MLQTGRTELHTTDTCCSYPATWQLITEQAHPEQNLLHCCCFIHVSELKNHLKCSQFSLHWWCRLSLVAAKWSTVFTNYSPCISVDWSFCLKTLWWEQLEWTKTLSGGIVMGWQFSVGWTQTYIEWNRFKSTIQCCWLLKSQSSCLAFGQSNPSAVQHH